MEVALRPPSRNFQQANFLTVDDTPRDTSDLFIRNIDTPEAFIRNNYALNPGFATPIKKEVNPYDITPQNHPNL